jgi:hypothetical protein
MKYNENERKTHLQTLTVGYPVLKHCLLAIASKLVACDTLFGVWCLEKITLVKVRMNFKWTKKIMKSGLSLRYSLVQF